MAHRNKDQDAGKHIKRPINSFMMFAKSMAASRPAALRGYSPQEFNRTLGQLWQVMTVEQKQEYVDKANAAREEHERQYPDYRYYHATS